MNVLNLRKKKNKNQTTNTNPMVLNLKLDGLAVYLNVIQNMD